MNETLSSKRYTIDIDLSNENTSHTLAIDLIGKNKKVLEIGTSTGYMSKLLKERGNHVIGVEIDPEAAEFASQYCELMIIGDVEVLDFDKYLKDVSFDVIVLTDVLEHLVWPAKTLENLRKYLKEDGYLVVSIPNVCHGDVILNLMNGNFKYSETGLLDKTHLRFFGENDFYNFFGECGFTVYNLHTTKIPIGCTELKINLNKVPNELIKFICSLPNSEVYQYVFCAKMSFDTRNEALLKESDLITNFKDSIQETVDEKTTPLLDEQSKLNNKISVLNKEISILNNQISIQSQKIQALENESLKKENQIDTQKIYLKEKISQISLLENDISLLKSSITFQLTSKFHNEFVEKLFPIGTKRRSFYDLPIRGGRVLINNGFKSFWNNFSLYINDKKKNRNNYASWILENEPDTSEVENLKIEAQQLPYRPLFSIITPVYNPPPEILKETIESVIKQTYDKWELILIDGNSKDENIKNILNVYSQKDSRIKVKILDKNLGISENSNEGVFLAKGEFISFLDHDDKLSPNCFYEVANLLNQQSNLDIIYSDNDKIDKDGNRLEPFFKPDWSLPMILSTNYLFHLLVCRKKLVDEIGGFRSKFDGAQDYDLVLRLIDKVQSENIAHIEKVLYHWRIISSSSASGSVAKPYAYEAGKRALEEYLIRNDISGEVTELEPGSYRVKKYINSTHKVGIVILDQSAKQQSIAELVTKIIASSTYEIAVVYIQNKDQDGLSNPKIKEHHNSIEKLDSMLKDDNLEYLIFVNSNRLDFNYFTLKKDWVEALIEHYEYFNAGAVGTGAPIYSNITFNIPRPSGPIFCIPSRLYQLYLKSNAIELCFDELQIELSDYSRSMGFKNVYTPHCIEPSLQNDQILKYYSDLRENSFFTSNMRYYLKDIFKK